MDFSVIRRRSKKPPPPKKAEPLPHAPPPPPPPRGPFSPYMEDLGRLERLKSVEVANYYRLNFDDYPTQQFGTYHHYPVNYNHDHHHNPPPRPRMAPPPSNYHHAPPPRLGPGTCHCEWPSGARHGAWLFLRPIATMLHRPGSASPYQLDCDYGLPGPPPLPYLQCYGSPAYSIDEDPNACMNM